MGVAAARSLHHDAARAVCDGRPDQGAVGAHGGRHEGDRLRGGVGQPRQGRPSRPATRQPQAVIGDVAQRSIMRAAEGGVGERVDLDHVVRRQDEAAHHDRRADARAAGSAAHRTASRRFWGPS